MVLRSSIFLVAYHLVASTIFLTVANSAGGGIRTPDLMLTKQLLFQLSYTSKMKNGFAEISMSNQTARVQFCLTYQI